ncbi:MAG: hypothetical protein ABIK89_19665 [Planctomycetota bacterium]
MVRRLLLIGMAAVALSVAGTLDLDGSAGQAQAAELVTFANGYGYYVQPGPGALGAQLYVCPRPTPPLVGHTYITYQPLAPHEFLYKHSRTYRVRHPDDSRTKVKVKWY